MNAIQLKALARDLNHAAWMAGSLDADDSWTKSDRAAAKRDEALKALCDAIDAALPTLRAADTISLGAIETTEDDTTLSFSALEQFP